MSIMIKKIIHKKKLFALIIDKSFRKLKGVNFLTNPKDTQQIGYMKHKKKHVIQPHLHKKRLTKRTRTAKWRGRRDEVIISAVITGPKSNCIVKTPYRVADSL